jgi:hypothetical protein
MARLGCLCGAEMSNTIAPSTNIISIFYKKEIEKVLEYNPSIRLWDLYTGWDELDNCNKSFQDRVESVEYWYCTQCQRVYEVQAKSCGKILRVYKKNCERCDLNIDVLKGLEELIVLTDLEMDQVLSLEEDRTLKQYLDEEKTQQFFISKDERIVYMYNNKTNNTFVYNQEDVV